VTATIARRDRPGVGGPFERATVGLYRHTQTGGRHCPYKRPGVLPRAPRLSGGSCWANVHAMNKWLSAEGYKAPAV
jgi:hypothetical protein